MGIEEGETYGHAETMVGDMKKEEVSIAELYDYISKANEHVFNKIEYFNLSSHINTCTTN